jgi:TolB-like protein/DNA-binding winged helix-turn-helix (wHTH) protein
MIDSMELVGVSSWRLEVVRRARRWYAARQFTIPMTKGRTAGRVIRFGAYDVDLAGQELLKLGLRIKLQPKPLQVLTILLEHAGTTITRDELKKLLWEPDTFVDFDHGLNAAVNKIRDALNDSAENPQFIETLPNGYRFKGVVDYGVPAALESSVPTLDSTERSARGMRFWQPRAGVIAIATVCVLLTSLFAVRYQHAFFSRPKMNVKSIAVLPLRNLSGDPSQEFFSDSLTDELITQLAKTSTLRVVSAASVMRFKNANASIPEIGRQLNVDAFVEGSVLRSGDQVRITAQLIDAATDRHIWADDYHGEVRNILVLQNDIAAAIAAKVQAGVAPNERKTVRQPHQVDPRAYDAYIKGHGHWMHSKMFRGDSDDLKKSGEEFREAISFDPSYAPAYAGLANYYGLLAGSGDLAPNDGWKLSEEAARKALALDESSAGAHHALATKLMYYDWDWAGAEREIRLGIEADPHYAELHNVYAHYLAYTGRFDESIAEAHRAEELDPLGERTSVQRALGFSRRYDLLLPEMEKVFKSDPVRIHEEKAIVYMARKQYSQEVEEISQVLRLDGCSACADRLARAYARGGYRGWLETRLSDLKMHSGKEPVSAFQFAELYTRLGNATMAMQYLEAAYREHTALVVRLQVNPAFDALHSDPRYQDLIRRIGLPLQAVPAT